MDKTRFDQILDVRLKKARATLGAKGQEYAHGDRLSNFKALAALTGRSPEDALMGLVGKHIVALYDFVNEVNGGKVRSYPFWDEKVGDIIAYMILLDALILEREKE